MIDRSETSAPLVWAPSVGRQVAIAALALLTPLLLGFLLARGLWHLDDALAERERPIPVEVAD